MIPDHTKHALVEWVQYGNQYDHGSFLMALVSNDLMMAFHTADDINMHSMLDIIKWMYYNLPCTCYGSKEKSESWHGMREDEFKIWMEKRDT